MASWAPGAPCWVLVRGEFDEAPWGMFEAAVTAADAKGNVTVARTGRSELTAPWGKVEAGVDVEVRGLSEGNGKACLAKRAATFPAEGYPDMTNMNELNDAELARNLRTLYNKDEAYCKCGATLVCMNLMKRVPVYGPNDVERYQHDEDDAQSPHIFGLAASCFRTIGLGE